MGLNSTSSAARRRAMSEDLQVTKTTTTPMQPKLVSVATRRQTPMEQQQFELLFRSLLAHWAARDDEKEG